MVCNYSSFLLFFGCLEALSLYISFVLIVFMAVVKLSGSKKAVQFVLSEDVPAGTVFQCSTVVYELLLKGQARGGFVVLSRLANPTSPERFPKSVVWGESTGASDSFSERGKRLSDEQKVVKKGEGFSPW